MPKEPVVLSRRSVEKAIGLLNCVEDVNAMLLEQTPAVAVARWLQNDMGELVDVAEETLASALRKRRQDLLKAGGFWDGGETVFAGEEGSGDDEGLALALPTPNRMAYKMYEQTHIKLKTLIEAEALYYAARDRVSRLMELEHAVGAFTDDTTKALKEARELLASIHQMSEGLLGGMKKDGEFGFDLTVHGYSSRTAEVLQNPAARRRVMALLERIGVDMMGEALPAPASSDSAA